VRGVTRFAVRRADAVLTPSLAFERVCREEGARDCRFVPHGVDGPGPQELAAAIEARRSRGADGAPVRLVSVGRLVPERRHALLLETLAALPPPGGEGELTLAGEGPERRRLEALARGLPPGWRVRLAGRVPAAEVARLLAGADLYLSATTVETFGLATLEAAAWGLPIVATAVGYPAELLAPDAARLVDAGDGLALGAALDGLLRAAEPRLALGRLARARFEEAALSWESAAGRTLAVYRSVLAARSRARDLR
jgi:glycosyltransferase involved in cell wall biosynthesis